MIEILHYETANKNKIIGFVDIRLTMGDIKMIIRKIAHFQNGDRKWFNLPTFVKEKSDGQKAFLKYWQLETEVHNGQLMERLPALVTDYCEKNKIKQIAPLDFGHGSPIDFTEAVPF